MEVEANRPKQDTLKVTLHQARAKAARRRDLQRLISNGLPDLANEDVMRAAWQRRRSKQRWLNDYVPRNCL